MLNSRGAGLACCNQGTARCWRPRPSAAAFSTWQHQYLVSAHACIQLHAGRHSEVSPGCLRVFCSWVTSAWLYVSSQHHGRFRILSARTHRHTNSHRLSLQSAARQAAGRSSASTNLINVRSARALHSQLHEVRSTVRFSST